MSIIMQELSSKSVHSRLGALVLLGVALCFPLRADMMYVVGTITQSLADSFQTAVANPSLQNVADGDDYRVALNFAGTISSPGTYALTSVSFTDASAGASEAGFVSGSMTISDTGAFDQFSVLGCLADCLTGNYIALNFQIPNDALNKTLSAATAIPSLTPMDLVEDDSNSEIQGSISGYSYQTPEPATLPLAAAGLACIVLARRRFAGQRI